MRRITINLPHDSWQGVDVPENKTIEEALEGLLEITPEIQQQINTRFGTPVERAADKINPVQVIQRLNAAIAATADPIAPTGTTPQILLAIVAEINAMRVRENDIYKLLKALVRAQTED